MIRITVAALALALAVPVLAGAQGKTDFSGTWNVDTAKSDPAPQGGGGGGRGGGRGMGGGPTTKLVITQTPADLTVVATNPRGETKTVYKLDGTETADTNQMGETKSKASWDGAKLVITRVSNLNTPQGAFAITSKEVYSLEAGALTLVTSRTTPIGDTTRKTVFNKG